MFGQLIPSTDFEFKMKNLCRSWKLIIIKSDREYVGRGKNSDIGSSTTAFATNLKLISLVGCRWFHYVLLITKNCSGLLLSVLSEY